MGEEEEGGREGGREGWVRRKGWREARRGEGKKLGGVFNGRFRDLIYKQTLACLQQLL